MISNRLIGLKPFFFKQSFKLLLLKQFKCSKGWIGPFLMVITFLLISFFPFGTPIDKIPPFIKIFFKFKITLSKFATCSNTCSNFITWKKLL